MPLHCFTSRLFCGKSRCKACRMLSSLFHCRNQSCTALAAEFQNNLLSCKVAIASVKATKRVKKAAKSGSVQHDQICPQKVWLASFQLCICKLACALPWPSHSLAGCTGSWHQALHSNKGTNFGHKQSIFKMIVLEEVHWKCIPHGLLRALNCTGLTQWSLMMSGQDDF